MTVLLVALVAVSGGLGAMLRFGLDRGVTKMLLARGGKFATFPWGIVLVNLVGSFALGLLVGIGRGGETGGELGTVWPALSAALSTGLLGGFTTMSTASLDTVRLYREKRYLAAGIHAFGTLIASVSLVLAGVLLGTVL